MRIIDTGTLEVQRWPTLPCPVGLPGCALDEPGMPATAFCGRSPPMRQAGPADWSGERPGEPTPVTAVRLPSVARTYETSVAPGGAVLVSALGAGLPTRSAFVVVWDGAHARRLPTTIQQPAW